MFYPGFNIKLNNELLDYIYGDEVFGPEVERRTLDSIRKSLKNQEAEGPDILYAIAMDVGNKEDKEELIKRNLLYGTVIYSKGKIGEEPVRSQGHVHAISKSCKMSTPEVYEIWQGEAYIYMQEYSDDFSGRCFAVHAREGEVVIVPPNWAHYTVNANPERNLVFGAWCVRDYGFEYENVRKKGGLAYFPILDDVNSIKWVKNEKYTSLEIIEKRPREYKEFDITSEAIYTQFKKNKDKFMFVSNPKLKEREWNKFIP